MRISLVRGIRSGWWSGMSKSKVRIKLNRAGVRELMRSPEMQAILMEQAEKIARESETEAYVAQTRAVVKVYGDGGNNELLKAMGGNAQTRTGKQVQGYWRTGKNGQKVWVRSYQRRK